MILCVAGNPSIDKLFVVERLRAGEIHRPVDFVQVPGGKGLNVARAAREAGVRTALDARGTALAMGIAAGPDVVKVNAAEAAELLGRPAESEADSLAAARQLRRLAGLQGRAGLVTRGAEGVVLAAPDGSQWAGRLDAWGPYAVGSGDCFLAGTVAALERGARWPEPLSLALGAAAA